jgi:hypothetical protein
MRQTLLVVLLIGSLLLSACSTSNPQPTATAVPPTAVATNAPASTSTAASPTTAAPTTTTAASATTAPTAAVTQVPTEAATQAATAASTAVPGPTSSPSPAAYLDDRSSAASVMQSLVSAINLHQYVRARITIGPPTRHSYSPSRSFRPVTLIQNQSN